MKIEDLKLKLISSSWDAETLEIGIRANFKCEYCGCDFFSSVNDYDSIQRDHLIPVIAGGTDTFENFVLSYKTCNYIKRNWHPLIDIIKNLNREELLERAKKYVLEKRKVKENRMNQEKELALKLIIEIKSKSIQT